MMCAHCFNNKTRYRKNPLTLYNMIKYIIFDFDGTIADTFNVIKSIVKDEFGATDKEFELFRNEGGKSFLKKMNIPLWKLPKMTLMVTSKLKSNNDIKLFPGIIELLSNLKDNYKIGIVSSNSKENIIDTLQIYNIQHLFEFIYSESSFFGKHLVLKKMCSKYNINPFGTIYIGDEDRDIVAAKKVHIKNIAVTWGFNSKEKLSKENPDYLVDLPIEILEIIYQN